MQSLPTPYQALVIGSQGAIGRAFTEQLGRDPRCGGVVELGRHTDPPVDYMHEDSLANAAAAWRDRGPFHLVLVATGLLHSSTAQPEKRLADLALGTMEEVFRVNTFGPALVLRHFGPLLARERSLMALLAARVVSIGDNRLGGWYAYRASKAALNQLVRTAAVEFTRRNPESVCVALHPGTVATGLSAPFRTQGPGVHDPGTAAAKLIAVLEALPPTASGGFFDAEGKPVPW